VRVRRLEKMKASISINECLRIIPEIELEAYALRKWAEDKGLGPNIVVETIWPRDNIKKSEIK